MKHTLLCVVVLASPFMAGLVAQTTPASGAPKGLLTAVEGRNHDSFIDRARAGNIDLVFFGTTDTAMWLWPDTISGGVDRGKRVWDQAFGSLKAAGFGSAGTHFASLLWRMQNGELDGYQAKLVVLHGISSKGITGDQLIGDQQAEFVAGYARLIAEVRARQPQAKILLMPPFPRGRLNREAWRAVADANAAVYRRLADDSTVFFEDIGDRFFRADGSHNSEMWTMTPTPPNAGIHEPGFKAWAGALQPWINRFVQSQDPTPPLTFEAASVKRNLNADAVRGIRPVTPSGIFVATVTVDELIRVVYGNPNQLFSSQVAGEPDWMRNDVFEITATMQGPMSEVPGGPPLRLFAMVRQLLAERFKLQVRKETRQLPVYDLVLDRKDGRFGPGLKSFDGTCAPQPTVDASGRPDFSGMCGFSRYTPTVIAGRGMLMEQLAVGLATWPDVQRVVRNLTGLDGRFDITLEHTNSPADSDSSLFTAIREQLGLKLSAGTGPVEVLVIERVEPPTID